MSTPQKGSGWSIRLAKVAYECFGYRALFYLLYPIAGFYYLFANDVRKNLRIFYENIEIPFSETTYFDHLRHFAICMTDRFITKIEGDNYRYDFEDLEQFLASIENGAIVLLSHFGGWASVINYPALKSIKINILMQEVIKDSIKEIEEEITDKEGFSHINIIDLSEGGISVAIKTADALLKKEIVAMMGDRPTSAKGSFEGLFFGKTARFNKNPFEIAYKTDKPVIMLSIIYKEIRHYDVKMSSIKLDRTLDRDSAVDKAIKSYISELENIILLYPKQWFNLYNFWSEDETLMSTN